MNQTEAARAVLIEVLQVLGAFRNDLVIVGGWVPELKYPGRNHVGSLDVDLAVGPGAVGRDAYSTILHRLSQKNYSHEINPTRFYRAIPGAPEPVKVDLICGEYANDEKAAAIQVDELRVNALHGLDLAFDHSEEIEISGTMPDGTHNVVRARIVLPEAFVLLKAFALADRAKVKDAYDISFILHYHEPTIAALAVRMSPLVAGGLGAEAYQILREKYATLASVGPSWSARIAEENGEDAEQARQAAWQDAQELFRELKAAMG